MRKGKKKAADHLPPALRDQWLRDRAKKAEYKKARAEARALAALDPFPSSRKSGKKKDKYGNRIYQHDRNDDRPEGPIVPIVDLVTLTRQIRVFIDELSRPTMVLPPMDKDSRRRVHVIAECFSLKSTSRGSGDRRYTTLTKTSRSGLGVNEKKLGGILRGKGADMPFFKAYDRRGGADSGKNGGGGGAPRHKDGDVVGSKAAKIGEANVGFKLLQRMGYAIPFFTWRMHDSMVFIIQVDGRRADWCDGRSGRPAHSGHQEYQAGLGSCVRRPMMWYTTRTYRRPIFRIQSKSIICE